MPYSYFSVTLFSTPLRGEKNKKTITLNTTQALLSLPTIQRQAELDRVNREQILERLGCYLEVRNVKHKNKAPCKLLLHHSMGYYVKELKSGKLRIDKACPRTGVRGTLPRPWGN